jgi:hypothetical protein
MTDASTPTRQEFFKITSVCRKDLKVLGFDTSNVDDETMEYLAGLMSRDYWEQLFWNHLEIFAEECDIPRNPNYTGEPNFEPDPRD